MMEAGVSDLSERVIMLMKNKVHKFSSLVRWYSKYMQLLFLQCMYATSLQEQSICPMSQGCCLFAEADSKPFEEARKSGAIIQSGSGLPSDEELKESARLFLALVKEERWRILGNKKCTTWSAVCLHGSGIFHFISGCSASGLSVV